AARPEILPDKKWARAAVREDDYPCLGIYVQDADECARWLGGELPTIQQWAKAAGFHKKDHREGPFRKPDHGPPRLAIQGRLMKRGEETDDVSPYGCRHLSGNGKEFTRNLAVPSGEMVPLPNPGERDAVMLRGWSFMRDDPFLLEYLEGTDQLEE